MKFSEALLFVTISSLGYLVSGDSNALMVADNQPPKLPTFEG